MAEKVSKKATVITYTEKEMDAINVLNAHKGTPMSAKELGIPTAILTSLIKKSNDERPMADGVERVFVDKEDYESVCPTCGAKVAHKLYSIR